MTNKQYERRRFSTIQPSTFSDTESISSTSSKRPQKTPKLNTQICSYLKEWSAVLVALFGFAVVTLGVVTYFKQINDSREQLLSLLIIDSPCHPRYLLWESGGYSGPSSHTELYVANFTNPEAFLLGLDRPRVAYLGPFFLNTRFTKTRVEFLDDGNRVKYHSRRIYTLNTAMSALGASMDAVIVQPNPIFFAARSLAKKYGLEAHTILLALAVQVGLVDFFVDPARWVDDRGWAPTGIPSFSAVTDPNSTFFVPLLSNVSGFVTNTTLLQAARAQFSLWGNGLSGLLSFSLFYVEQKRLVLANNRAGPAENTAAGANRVLFLYCEAVSARSIAAVSRSVGGLFGGLSFHRLSVMDAFLGDSKIAALIGIFNTSFLANRTQSEPSIVRTGKDDPAFAGMDYFQLREGRSAIFGEFDSDGERGNFSIPVTGRSQGIQPFLPKKNIIPLYISTVNRNLDFRATGTASIFDVDNIVYRSDLARAFLKDESVGNLINGFINAEPTSSGVPVALSLPLMASTAGEPASAEPPRAYQDAVRTVAPSEGGHKMGATPTSTLSNAGRYCRAVEWAQTLLTPLSAIRSLPSLASRVWLNATSSEHDALTVFIGLLNQSGYSVRDVRNALPLASMPALASAFADNLLRGVPSNMTTVAAALKELQNLLNRHTVASTWITCLAGAIPDSIQERFTGGNASSSSSIPTHSTTSGIVKDVLSARFPDRNSVLLEPITGVVTKAVFGLSFNLFMSLRQTFFDDGLCAFSHGDLARFVESNFSTRLFNASNSGNWATDGELGDSMPLLTREMIALVHGWLPPDTAETVAEMNTLLNISAAGRGGSLFQWSGDHLQKTGSPNVTELAVHLGYRFTAQKLLRRLPCAVSDAIIQRLQTFANTSWMSSTALDSRLPRMDIQNCNTSSTSYGGQYPNATVAVPLAIVFSKGEMAPEDADFVIYWTKERLTSRNMMMIVVILTGGASLIAAMTILTIQTSAIRQSIMTIGDVRE